jgi:membrane protease YdiL (CAAX protease family)
MAQPQDISEEECRTSTEQEARRGPRTFGNVRGMYDTVHDAPTAGSVPWDAIVPRAARLLGAEGRPAAAFKDIPSVARAPTKEGGLPELPADATSRGRSEILRFVLLALVSSIAFQLLELRAMEKGSTLLFFASLAGLMWSPTACALSMQLLQGRRGRALFRILRRGDGRPFPWLISVLFAPLIGGLAYLAAWGGGLAEFAPPSMARWGLEAAPPTLRFLAHAAVSLAVGVPFTLFLALGEELAWRGYLMNRLMPYGTRAAVFGSTGIWILWHVPALALGLFPLVPHRALGAFGFCVMMMALGVLLARLRLASKSIWPPTLLHAIWNVCLGEVLEKASKHPTAWTTEYGVLVASLAALGAWWLSRRRDDGSAVLPSSDRRKTARMMPQVTSSP